MIQNMFCRLDITTKIYCDPTYYGPDCAIQCISEDVDAHFTCDPKTGQKTCKEGELLN